MPGPLPDPAARRRNAPTIPTTTLPAAGREEPAPDSPYALGEAGSTWWDWAWHTPQAAAWDTGALYHIARRAQLEDAAAALSFTDQLDLNDLFAGVADRAATQRVEWALTMLKKSASGELAIAKEMRELDNKLGLNPEALAKLRWTIVAEPQAVATPKAAKPRPKSHLRAVDPALADDA